MAGRRRELGKPMKRDLAAERQRMKLARALGAATSPRQRVKVACDFVLGVLGPNSSAQQTKVLVRDMREAADRIWLDRRHADLEQELAAAGTLRDELSISVDYLRKAMAAAAPADGRPDPAAETAERLVHRLIEAGERLQGGGR
jgi:hypothetical protein